MRLVKDPIEDIRPGTMTTPCNEFDIDFIVSNLWFILRDTLTKVPHADSSNWF